MVQGAPEAITTLDHEHQLGLECQAPGIPDDPTPAKRTVVHCIMNERTVHPANDVTHVVQQFFAEQLIQQ